MIRLKAHSHRTVSGKYYGTPKEVWGFRSGREKGASANIATRFLKANSDLFGLRPDIGELTQRPPRVIKSLGATHVILQQVHKRQRIHRAYVTVHIDGQNRVYLAKNRAMPAPFLPKVRGKLRGQKSSLRRAMDAVGVSAGACRQIGEMERIWYPYEDGLRMTHKVRLQLQQPKQEWIVYVDARSGEIVSQYDNLSAARGKARIFNPNPVVALGDYRKATTSAGKPKKRIPASAYSNVYLRDLDGTGYVQGPRVTTAPTKGRVHKRDLVFLFSPRDRRYRTGLREAMAYYHIDNAVRYLEKLGYSGDQAIFQGPIPVDVKGTRADNSWYSPGEKQLTFGTGGVDDAEDGETILHEFGHALQDAIIPDFGQSVQAAAIGEGFGDYFAASFYAPKKSAKYETSVMTWDGVTYNVGYYDPPCVRRVDEDYTFEDFEHDKDYASEHENGLIWSATLWAIRRSIGRRRADSIIIESHFQLDGFTTFARAARAILDANRNLYRDRYRSRIERIFNERGIGPIV